MGTGAYKTRETALTRTGLQTPRDRIWNAMIKSRLFTVPRLHKALRAGPRPVSLAFIEAYVQGLIKAGYVEVLAPADKGARGRFQAADLGLTPKAKGPAPMVGADGKLLQAPVINTAMWRAIRIRKVVDAAQVAQDASMYDITCSQATAKKYLQALAHAGYLVVAAQAGNTAGALQRYRLVRDTGPLPPAVTRTKCVLDRNTGAIEPAQTAQEVCDALA